jgi:hypothetical protein
MVIVEEEFKLALVVGWVYSLMDLSDRDGFNTNDLSAQD